MRLLRNLLLVCAATGTLFASVDPIPKSEYKQRRTALRTAAGQSVIILFGAKEGENGELRTGFFQEPNFYYLTGWKEPDAILVMTGSSDILLIPARNKEHEKWTGHKMAPGDPGMIDATGVETVLATESFEAKLPQWIEAAGRIYTLTHEPGGDGLKKLLPLRDIADVGPLIARQRMVKSSAEIAAIQKSTDITIDAHKAAWQMTKPGVGEYQVAGVMMGSYFAAGCERNAYSPIVGSGPNAAVLHYSQNSRKVDNGELVLMDVAAECSMYSSDITRTIPSSGKFSARQKEIYEIVLGAQNAVIKAIKPGMTLGNGSNGLNKIAKDYINSHGKDKHGETLGKYFNHGVSHHVGLEVHDAFERGSELSENMVITVEPGIYIPEEGIGIRIEDVVLVTKDGAKVLSSALPREPQEIERALAASH